MTTAVANQIRFQCPGCSRSYRAPGRLLGKQVTCANCKTTVRLGDSKSKHDDRGGLEILPSRRASGPEPVGDRHAGGEHAVARADSPRERRRRIREREFNDPNLLRQLDNAGNMALIWALIGGMCPILGLFAIKKGNDARYLARRMKRPVPGTATVGLILGWLSVIGFLVFVLTLVASIAVVALRM